MTDIYSQEFLYHYKNQTNNKMLDKFTNSGKDVNFSCGDEIEVQILTDESGKITDIGYKSDGCIISTGTMSILSEELIGKNISEIKDLTKEKVLELIGIEVTPSREKCVMVSINALRDAIK
jgi:nitrogen fixation NifU-like protein